MSRISRRHLLFGAAATLAAAGWSTLSAQAQSAAGYPSRPVTLIVPFAAGGATDVAARVFAKGLSEGLKQPVLVDNRPGGTGTIGMDLVAKSPADGYTLLYVGGGSLSQTFFARKLTTDLLRDLTPVVQLARGEFFLFVRGDLPVKSVEEFVDMVKAKPGQYNYASIAATQMMPMEMLMHRAKLQMVHVAFKSTGQVQQAFSGQDIIATVASPVGYEPMLQSGKMRPLMVFGDERSPLAPEVPTAAESGLAGLRSPFSFAVWAPAATPADIVGKLNQAFNQVLSRPDAQDFVKRQGGIPGGGASQVQTIYVQGEHAYWAQAARVAKYSPE